VTGGICTASAANIEGTIVNSMLNESGQVSPHRRLSIEHPSGVLDIGLSEGTNSPTEFTAATVERTVALIAEAQIFYATPKVRHNDHTPILSPVIQDTNWNPFQSNYSMTARLEEPVLPFQQHHHHMLGSAVSPHTRIVCS
jgi:hypothetical protein